jgi:hypothetical protein
VLLAYEPWWAIGAPAPADPVYVDRVVAVLRTFLQERFGTDTGIFYGGARARGFYRVSAPSMVCSWAGSPMNRPTWGPSLMRRLLPDRRSALAHVSNQLSTRS